MNDSSIPILEKLLTGIAITLTVLIFAGSVLGLIRKSSKNIEAGSKTAQNLVAKGKAVSLNAPPETDETAYFALGTIRLSTKKDEKKSAEGRVLVISPWLSYQKGDDVFYEELSRKRGLIKAVFSSYFSSKTQKELSGKTEEKISEELLLEVNSRLSLGAVKNIHFTDYIFFE